MHSCCRLVQVELMLNLLLVFCILHCTGAAAVLCLTCTLVSLSVEVNMPVPLSHCLCLIWVQYQSLLC